MTLHAMLLKKRPDQLIKSNGSILPSNRLAEPTYGSKIDEKKEQEG